jgi:invasion protein IalB
MIPRKLIFSERYLLAALPLLLGAAGPAPPHPTHTTAAATPKALGKYEDWTAATHIEAGQTVCYAFTRAASSSAQISGRGDVVLTVTERTDGRDAVAISAGFAFAANAAVTVDVDATKLDFYTAQRNAFARDGHAAVAAFSKGSKALAHLPAPRNVAVTDTFSLRGFSAAYAAINKACPAK